LERIEESALKDCSNLKSLQVPKNVRFIDGSAFQGVPVNSITVEAGSGSFRAPSPEGLFYDLGRNAISRYSGTCTEVCVPDNIQILGQSAFISSKVKIVRLGSALHTIEDKCFSHCADLEETIFDPNSRLQRIGQSAYASSGLKRIRIPRSVAVIGHSCFCRCRLISDFNLETDSKLTKIEEKTFSDSSITQFTIPDSVERIEASAFANCPMTAVTIPVSVQFIHSTAFQNVPLQSVAVAPGSRSYVIASSALYDLSRGNLVRYFGNSPSVLIENSVQVIGEHSFSSCGTLNELTFEAPSSLQGIGDCAFFRSSLKQIQIPPSVERLGWSCFASCAQLEIVAFVSPSQSRLRSICHQAFRSSTLRQIEIPDSVELFESDCFCFCQRLESVRFWSIAASKLREIRSSAFYRNTSLREITLPNSVEDLGDDSFSGCEALQVMTLGCGLKQIGESAFCGSGLKQIEIPGSVVKLCESCFARCGELEIVRFVHSSRLERIGSKAFEGCLRLNALDIPSSVLCIGIDAIPAATAVSLIGNVPVRQFMCWRLRRKANPHLPLNRISGASGGSPMVADWILPDFPSGFEEIRLIYRGPRGSDVRLWKDQETGQCVVVKTFPLALETEDEDARMAANSMIFREIGALIELEHPCIVPLYGVVLPTATAGSQIATRYMKDGSLADVLKSALKSAVDWWTPTAKAITVVGIVLGMIFIHSHDYLHRDLKPANILLGKNSMNAVNEVRICDFGSARLFVENAAATEQPGTLLYTAPEMFDEGPYTQTVDVYSFALIFYEIIVGKAVFAEFEKKLKILMKKIVEGLGSRTPPPVRSEVQTIITKGWSTNESERPMFTEIFNDLKSIRYQIIDGVDSSVVEAFVQSVQNEQQGRE
jgi:hypothetical protein